MTLSVFSRILEPWYPKNTPQGSVVVLSCCRSRERRRSKARGDACQGGREHAQLQQRAMETACGTDTSLGATPHGAVAPSRCTSAGPTCVIGDCSTCCIMSAWLPAPPPGAPPKPSPPMAAARGSPPAADAGEASPPAAAPPGLHAQHTEGDKEGSSVGKFDAEGVDSLGACPQQAPEGRRQQLQCGACCRCYAPGCAAAATGAAAAAVCRLVLDHVNDVILGEAWKWEIAWERKTREGGRASGCPPLPPPPTGCWDHIADCAAFRPVKRDQLRAPSCRRVLDQRETSP